MATICITGGTGMVGKRLISHLTEAGFDVIILTRNPSLKSGTGKIRYAGWDPENQTLDAAAIAESDYIIHLAGAGVAEKRWTEKRKQEIRDSRVNSGALLVKTLKETQHRVKAVISASAIGWYGPDNGIIFDENAPAAPDFLGDTCRQWEASVDPLTAMGIRLVKLRIGIVLSTAGGALAEFMKPIRMGIAGVLGDGKQMISWIHIDDLCRMFVYAIKQEQMQGTYNAVAPKPVSNRTLTLQLAQVMKGSFFIPMHVPAWVLRIVLGEMSIEVLKSCTASAEKIKNAGFVFQYPGIDAALQALVDKKK